MLLAMFAKKHQKFKSLHNKQLSVKFDIVRQATKKWLCMLFVILIKGDSTFCLLVVRVSIQLSAVNTLNILIQNNIYTCTDSQKIIQM